MKRTLTLLIASMFIIGCQNQEEKVIDGCQYIELSSYNGNGGWIKSLTHKGNCNNPIHKPKSDTITFKK